MDLDRAHLDAGQQALGRVHIEIRLIVAVFLLDRDMLDRLAEAAGVMLLEEAFLRAALRAAHEADRARPRPGEHDRRDRGIIVLEFALGETRLGLADTVAVAYRAALGSGGGLPILLGFADARLVVLI